MRQIMKALENISRTVFFLVRRIGRSLLKISLVYCVEVVEVVIETVVPSRVVKLWIGRRVLVE